jgi:SAM-dependent methyltransferase
VRLLDLRASDIALDNGCGTAKFAAWNADKVRLMVGSDPATLFADAAVAQVALARADSRRLPFADSSIDKAFSIDVLEHFPREVIDAYLLETARVLRPGGLIVMATPNLDALDARVFGERWALWEAPRHFNIFSAPSLGRLLRANGFGDVTSECLVGTWFGFATSLQYLWEERRGFRPAPGDGARPYWDTRLPMQALRVLALPYTWLADRLGAGSAMVVCADRVGSDRTGRPRADAAGSL